MGVSGVVTVRVTSLLLFRVRVGMKMREKVRVSLRVAVVIG